LVASSALADRRAQRQRRQQLLEAARSRYPTLSYQEKGALVDELVALSGYHRKSVLRLLRQQPAVTFGVVLERHAVGYVADPWRSRVWLLDRATAARRPSLPVFPPLNFTEKGLGLIPLRRRVLWRKSVPGGNRSGWLMQVFPVNMYRKWVMKALEFPRMD
jgi:hypothetical protein